MLMLNEKHKLKLLKSIENTIEIRQQILADEKLINNILQSVLAIVESYKSGGKVLMAGNGGSAADAQHMVAELVGRFYYDRPPLNAEAICTNTSDLTCIGNDYGYEFTFSRAIQAKGKAGDVFVAISTSGNSPNIINAAAAAKKLGLKVVALTGQAGGKLSEYADVLIKAPSSDTARIQECHTMFGHFICEFVEAELFPK